MNDDDYSESSEIFEGVHRNEKGDNNIEQRSRREDDRDDNDRSNQNIPRADENDDVDNDSDDFHTGGRRRGKLKRRRIVRDLEDEDDFDSVRDNQGEGEDVDNSTNRRQVRENTDLLDHLEEERLRERQIEYRREQGLANFTQSQSQDDFDDDDEDMSMYDNSRNRNSNSNEEENNRDDIVVEEFNDGVIEEDGSYVSEEGDGDDLMDNAAADYVAIPELDVYDNTGIDNRAYEEMDYQTRLRAEEAIDERYMRRGRLDDFLDRYDEEGDEARDARRGRYRGDREEMDGYEDERGYNMEVIEEEEVNLETFDVNLTDWIAEHRTQREIKKRFKNFLLQYTDPISGRVVHEESIRAMCSANMASLEISYMSLSNQEPLLSIWLADQPKEMLEIFDDVANDVVLMLFPAYRSIVKDEIHVRITDLPIADQLRDLRQSHLNRLIKVTGVVTKRTPVCPQLKMVLYDCISCGNTLGPFKQGEGQETRPNMCPSCNKTIFRVNQEETIYRNYQTITLQESPGQVAPGRVPRYKEVILTSDLIDRAKPGEEIEVTGVYIHRHEASIAGRMGFPVFRTCIEANYIYKREDMFSSIHITDEDKREIHKLSKDPNIKKKLLGSLGPSIHGHENVKLAVLLSLFGGVEKNVKKKHRIRGDINVLLLGDPGTAKSQFLKYLEKVAPRAVYTTGKGASAVGLTAGVHKDPLTKEWTLEGGALVLSDRGMCLIDEFDKMNDSDRTSIHEALEQQSISISKAGIVTSLQARCSVVAAANPIGGRYDSSLTLAENVELTDPILQRFDVLCVLQDLVDPVVDEKLAKFVISSHMRSHPDEHAQEKEEQRGNEFSARKTANSQVSGQVNENDDTIPQKMVTKYIMYARANVKSQLHSIDQDKIARLYADLRRESQACGGVPIAVRHIESLMRLSEAHAKLHLREYVRDDDVNAAIGILLHSFLSAQKFSVRRSLERGFRRYLTNDRDYYELLMSELNKLLKDSQIYMQMRNIGFINRLEVHCEDFEMKAREYRIYDLTDFYNSDIFKSQNLSLDAQARLIIKSF